MGLLLYNDSWMAYNILLATIPVIFAWFTFSRIRKTYRVIFGILWFIFLPNTIYILTDFIHLLEDWQKVTITLRAILILQYVLLECTGLFLFILAFYPFEAALRKNHFDKRNIDSNIIIVACNYVIGLGMVLGRIERINSWEVLTNTGKVLSATITVFQSTEQLLLVFLFGTFVNLFYFLLRKKIIKKMHDIL